MLREEIHPESCSTADLWGILEGMSQRPNKGPKERVICFCYNVSEKTIIEAIRSGCSSLMDIRRETYASTGCAGCSEEVKKLLRKFAVAEPVTPPESSDPGKVSNG